MTGVRSHGLRAARHGDVRRRRGARLPGRRAHRPRHGHDRGAPGRPAAWTGCGRSAATSSSPRPPARISCSRPCGGTARGAHRPSSGRSRRCSARGAHRPRWPRRARPRRRRSRRSRSAGPPGVTRLAAPGAAAGPGRPAGAGRRPPAGPAHLGHRRPPGRAARQVGLQVHAAGVARAGAPAAAAAPRARLPGGIPAGQGPAHLLELRAGRPSAGRRSRSGCRGRAPRASRPAGPGRSAARRRTAWRPR